MTSPDRLHPVVLSGGSGTRLWPMSRASLPKQLLALHGKRTMIQDTVLRASVPGAVAPILLCSDGHRFLVAEQMQQIGVTPNAIVLEPVGRNTAPAAAIAALMVAEGDPQGIILLLPSDHVVTNETAFRAAIARAAAAAKLGYIVTFGIAPVGPETGYGYIQRGAPLANGRGRQFCADALPKSLTARPPNATSQPAIMSGTAACSYSAPISCSPRWNVLNPALSKPAARRWLPRSATWISSGSMQSSFEKAKNISIDYAVMEKTDKAAVVPCDIGWSDVGSWSSLWALRETRCRR